MELLQLEHFLAGDVPIRDFYYPYAPLLMPSMLLPYILVGHSLAGISDNDSGFHCGSSERLRLLSCSLEAYG